MSKLHTAARFKDEAGQLVPYVWKDGKLVRVAWAALPGSQAAFLAATEQICLYQGPRGGCGKTEALVADYLQDVDVGMDHKGILIRRTYPELEDCKSIAAKLIPKIYPTATYNETSSMWTFPTGATLRFRPFEDMNSWDRFLGRNVHWIGIDELATYRTLECMHNLLSLLRVGPRPRLRACTNTWGVGRDALLEYFQLTPARAPMVGPLIVGGDGPPRRVITGALAENIPLLYMHPDYLDTLRAATKDNSAKMQAWIDGMWSVPPTAFFGDVDWSAVMLPSFEPPTPGRIRLGYDHGTRDPSAAVFCWESDGSDIEFPDGSRMPTLRGDIFVLDEMVAQSKPGVGPQPMLYPADLAARIHAVIERHGWNPKIMTASGNVADSSIFSPGANDNRASVGDDFERHHIHFESADKARVLGWAEMLKRLAAARKPEHGIREQTGLFICENCTALLQSLPNLQRDDGNCDDIDTRQNDHEADALRYFLRRERTPPLKVRRWRL